MLVCVVLAIVLLTMLLGERSGLGRVVWLAIGVLLGLLWSVRSRLPLLQSTSLFVAGGAWIGLIVAGLMTLAVAPTSLTAALAGASPASASRTVHPNGLRQAPPTAVRRTGTVGPAPTAKPAVAASPAASPAPRVAASPLPRPASGSAARSTASPAARPAPTPTVVLPEGFSVARYLGKGDAFSCRDFTSQAEAQAVLRADPSDPNVIDNNRDGIACEDNPDPRDTRRVPR